MKHRVRILAASVGACVLCAFVIGASARLSVRRTHQQDEKSTKEQSEELRRRSAPVLEPVAVQNRTKHFTVVRTTVDPDGQEVILRFRNDYSKPVTGFLVTVGDCHIHVPLVCPDSLVGVLPPGAEKEDSFPNNDTNTYGVVILAVVFNDSTGDGEPSDVADLVDFNRGLKMERQYIIQHLRNLVESDDSRIPAEVDRILLRADVLSDEQRKHASLYLTWGVQEGQMFARLRFQQAFESGPNISLGDGQGDVAGSAYATNATGNLGKMLNILDDYTKTLEAF
jgi:hypothetical protein